MVGALVARGLLLGLLAGLVAGSFAFVVGEPLLDTAIAMERPLAGEAPVVSRSAQKAGLFLATGLYGLAVGGIFALVFAGLRGRVGPRSDGRLAAAVTATATARRVPGGPW
ncbi:CbtA family protein, partial [Nonomuraea lactucae]|uniref:CbtA family protein n=1 Tax=Nonomuraea lactucae TaxID=2249762 RepID=UPI0013B36B86